MSRRPCQQHRTRNPPSMDGPRWCCRCFGRPPSLGVAKGWFHAMITLITWMLFHFFSSSAKISLADEGDTWYVNRWNTFNQTERESKDPLSLITLKNLFVAYLYILWLLFEGAFETKMQMIANALTKLPSTVGPSIRHLVLTPFGTWHCQTIDWF